MIRLLENDGLTYTPKISFMQTACLHHGFKASPLAADIWIGENLVISRLGGRLNITDVENCDLDELKEFVSLVGFSEIFCEKQTALSLGFECFDEFAVLRKSSKKTKQAISHPSLSCLYSALKKGGDGDISLPPFEIFAPDVSHRLRHGGALANAEDFGGILAFTCPFGGVISGISVEEEMRGKGYGSRLLNDLCDQIDGEIFVCTSQKNANFYIKNGFKLCDTAVIIRG